MKEEQVVGIDTKTGDDYLGSSLAQEVGEQGLEESGGKQKRTGTYGKQVRCG